MLNPFKLLAVYRDLNKMQAVAKEQATMQVKIPQLVTLLVSLSATIGLPTLVTNWVHAHAVVYVAIVAVALVLHALMPSIFSEPSAADKQATGLGGVGAILLMVAVSLLCAQPVRAQSASSSTTTTTVSASNGFAASSDAVGLRYNGTWSAATIIEEKYDFLDFGVTKSNRLYIAGDELLAPTPGWNAYLGKVIVEPDLSKLLNKTNVQPGSFGAFVDAGVGTGIPSTGNGSIAWTVGGGVKYQLTSSLTWQSLQAHYGGIGAQRFQYISSGLSFIFGK